MTPAKADHWKQRAAEARLQAEMVSDPVARQSMLKIAESYERMAARAETHEVSMAGSNDHPETHSDASDT